MKKSILKSFLYCNDPIEARRLISSVDGDIIDDGSILFKDEMVPISDDILNKKFYNFLYKSITDVLIGGKIVKRKPYIEISKGLIRDLRFIKYYSSFSSSSFVEIILNIKRHHHFSPLDKLEAFILHSLDYVVDSIMEIVPFPLSFLSNVCKAAIISPNYLVLELIDVIKSDIGCREIDNFILEILDELKRDDCIYTLFNGNLHLTFDTTPSNTNFLYRVLFSDTYNSMYIVNGSKYIASYNPLVERPLNNVRVFLHVVNKHNSTKRIGLEYNTFSYYESYVVRINRKYDDEALVKFPSDFIHGIRVLFDGNNFKDSSNTIEL